MAIVLYLVGLQMLVLALVPLLPWLEELLLLVLVLVPEREQLLPPPREWSQRQGQLLRWEQGPLPLREQE